MRLPSLQLIFKLDALGEVALKKSPAFRDLFEAMVESEEGRAYLAGVVYTGLISVKVSEEKDVMRGLDELIAGIHAATK